MGKRKRSSHEQDVTGPKESKRARTEDSTLPPIAKKDEIADHLEGRAVDQERVNKAARREAKRQRKASWRPQKESQFSPQDQDSVKSRGAGTTGSAKERNAEGGTHEVSVRNEEQQRKASKVAQAKKQAPKQEQSAVKSSGEALDGSTPSQKNRIHHRDSKPKANGDSVPMQDLVTHGEKDNYKANRSYGTGLGIKGSAWSTLDAIGGQMLDIDPIFSRNEEYFLVAYHSHIAVYAASTSLLIRRLQTRKGFYIASMTLSPEDENKIYIASTSGLIELWNWNEGEKLEYWNTKRETQHLEAIKRSHESDHKIILTTYKLSDSSWQLSAHLLKDLRDGNNREEQPLFTCDQAVSSLQVLADATVIVMTSGDQLILGNRKGSSKPGLIDMIYTWRIMTCHEWISSIDVRLKQSEVGKKHVPSRRPAMDIVVGGLKGGIHIYDDLLQNLVRKEKSSKEDGSVDLHSRQLHWHRNAVLAVKWSRDGNYIISGGQETVLVMWQLDTGQKETLPHLGAPIEGLVVSPGGSCYGIRLADNSVMILSTSELRPLFSIAGIQAPAAVRGQPALPFVATIDQSYRISSRVELSCPACICPSRPGQILLGVPPFTSSRVPELRPRNNSYLQTFDVGSTHQISRQALARTNVSNLNMGPESNTIEEPNVTQIITSCDGQWLATVDEWMPPAKDLASLAFNSDREHEERLFRQEIYLKFWSWDNESKIWELVSRIDNPHASQLGNVYEGGRVLALAADPDSVGFSTFGEDGALKAWKPTSRRRNGNNVKGKDGALLINWHCKHTTPLMSLMQATANGRMAAKLAYSPDSSVVVLGLQLSAPSPIYLLDGLTDEIQSIQTGLYTGPLLGLGILDRYLIILSNELIVWDLVNDELHYGVDMGLPTLSFPKTTAFSHLAIDTLQHTLAIAVPKSSSKKHKTELKSHVAVFHPADIEPLLVTELPNALTALLPAVGRKGYYAIDTAAEVRTLTPGQTLPALPSTVPRVEERPHLGLNGIFGSAAQEKRNEKLGQIVEKSDSIIRQSSADLKDEAVVSRDQLAKIFDRGPSYALPPVSELFEQVAMLFNGQSRAITA